MNDSARFQRFAARVAILALPVALASSLLLVAAMDFNPFMFLNPTFLIAIGPAQGELIRWGMILDILGYYLPLLPLMLYLWTRYHMRSPNFVALYTACGLAFVLIGSMGAIILAAVLPSLINQYAQASGQQREMLSAVFGSIVNAVYLGLWNPLETGLLCIWFSGIGSFISSDRPAMGILARVFGLLGLIAVLGRIFNADLVFYVGVSGFLLYPFWAAWLGFDLLKSQAPVHGIESSQIVP